MVTHMACGNLVHFILGISLGAASVSLDRIIPTLLGDGSFKESFVLFQSVYQECLC